MAKPLDTSAHRKLHDALMEDPEYRTEYEIAQEEIFNYYNEEDDVTDAKD